MSRNSTPVYDYPSCAASPYQEESERPRSPPTPELAGTFMDRITPPMRQIARRRLGPIGQGRPIRWEATQANREAVQIANARRLFDSTVEEALATFQSDINRDGSISPIEQEMIPDRSPQQTQGEVFIALPDATPSPEPLPVHPRHGETPTPPPSESASPLPLYIRDDTPLAPPSPLVAEINPAGPQPGVSLGPDWFPNVLGDGIAFLLTVPDGDEGMTMATYVRINNNDGDPRIEGTLGLGCPINSNPLQARPNQYPRPILTDEELQIFRAGESYTPMINAALADDGDATLQAEVYRYRASSKRIIRLARQVVNAWYELHRERCTARCSARRLTEANAYAHLYPRVMWDYVHSDRWPEATHSDTVQQLTRRYNPIPLWDGVCNWCGRRGHDTE
jgi:hypothetical protein